MEITNKFANMPYIRVRKGTVVEVCSSFCELVSYSSDELLKKSIKSVFTELLGINIDLNSITNETQAYLFTKNLELRKIIIKVRRIKETDDKVYIFERRINSDLLTQLPFLNQLYIDNHYGIAIFDTQDFTLLKANSKYLEIMGLTVDKNYIGLTIKDFAPDFEGSEYEKSLNGIVITGETAYLSEFEGSIGGMKGKYWENTIAPLIIEGKAKLVVSLLIDVTERVVNRKKLEEQKELFEAILDNSYENLFAIDANGNFLFSNNSIIKEVSKKIINVDDVHKGVKYFDINRVEIDIERSFIDCLKNGEIVKDKVVIIKVDEKEYYLIYSGKPICDKDGKYLYGVVSSCNITAVVKNQQTLREKQEQLIKLEREKNETLKLSMEKIQFQARLLNLSNEAIFAWEFNGDVIYWNKGAERMYGYSSEEVIGKVIHKVLRTKYPYDINVVLPELEYSHIWSGEIEHISKDGRRLVIETYLQLIVNEEEKKIVLEINRDITERKKSEQILIETKNRLFVALESVAAGIWECDMVTNNQVWSPKVYELYGIDSTEPMTLEKGINRVYPEDREGFTYSLEEACKTHCDFWQKEFRIINSNRGIVWLRGTGKIIYDNTGTPIKMIGINIDITEQKERQKQIIEVEREKNEVLENTIKFKDEFLYLITHEFKTPLAVIKSALQAMDLLCMDQMPEKANKFLKSIKQNANRQLRLVNNLLDITRITSGNIKLNMRIYDIVYLTQSIVKSINTYADQKGVNLALTTAFSKKEILIDEEKFERILLNVLSNALKYTPSGKAIRVAIGEKRHKNKKMVSISIQDEGIGIPKDKRKHIFERFGQADTSLSRQAEGTGIGLYLVKLFVEAMGGDITLKSREKEGSIFTLLFSDNKSMPIVEAAACSESNEHLIQGDSRLIESVAVEFSDIYI